MLFDLSNAITTLASGTYAVTRRSGSSYSAGRLVVGTGTAISIIASVQPATGLVVRRLPEGKRNREAMTLWTKTELKTAQAAQLCDLIVIDGGTFEVESVQRWAALGNFYECVVLRLDET